MKPPPFAYHRPETRDEVDRLLAEHSDEAKILAGGQSLIPILNMRLSAPSHLIDINGLRDEPAEPALDDGVVRFSPLVRQGAAERWAGLWESAPLIADALRLTAHPAIRNRGTVVGSVAHADPSAELPAAVLALDGEIRVRGAGGARTVPAREFFVGALETSLAPGEWVEEVSVPAGRRGCAVEEFARRHGDYAICGVVAIARGGRVRLVFYGISDTPVIVETADRIRDVLAEVDVSDDLHGTARYRRHLAEVLGARAAARVAA
jgi:aerobic carbon-monoxide dehydrogenase medium subunit